MSKLSGRLTGRLVDRDTDGMSEQTGRLTGRLIDRDTDGTSKQTDWQADRETEILTETSLCILCCREDAETSYAKSSIPEFVFFGREKEKQIHTDR